MLNKIFRIVDEQLVEDAIEIFPKDQEKLVLNEPMGDFFYDSWQIKKEFIGTVWESLLNTLSVRKGEARVIKLKPGESYMAHADIDNRWHLNLTGEQSFLINLDQQQMHLTTKDYQWYYMEADKIHVAANFGSVDRLQIVVRELLKHTNDTDLISVTISPNGNQFDYRYKFDNILSPFLNKSNKDNHLTGFRFSGETVNFKISKSKISNLQSIITKDFLVTYE